MQAPMFGPDVPRTGRTLLVAAIAVGVLGGAWMMRPKPEGEGLLARLRSSRNAPVAAPAPVETPEAAPVAAKPSPVPSKNPPDIVPQAPTQPGEQQAKEEEAAERQYSIAMGFLKRQQNAQARQALQQLMVRYPQTRAFSQARDLLAQIPESTQTTQAGTRPPAPPPGSTAAATTPQRPLTMRERMAAESGAVPPAESAAAPAAVEPPATKRKVVIPPSLQGSQPAAATASIASSNLDDLKLISVVQESGRVILNLEYRLASQHTRQVFAGAWVQTGASSRFFSYSGAPLAPGAGTTRIILQGASVAEIPSLRVAFFEEGGQRFFIKDVVLSR